MCDSHINRRAFTAGSIATGAALIAASVARAQDAGVAEAEIQIKTPDGMTDAALYTPKGKGPFPGVLIFTDIFGLRPASRDVGRRLATNGYVAVVTNPFYRTKKGPLMEPAVQATFNFQRDGALLQLHLAVLTPDAVTHDELAWLAYLDALPQVSKTARLGVDGYCMGGPRVVQASALRPDRVGAAFTAHPGNGLVTDKPDSPHLLAPKIKAKSFFAIAQNDAMQKPDIVDQLKAAYAAAGNPCGAEVFKANHGWTMPDSAVYNKDEAERAWVVRLGLYKSALA